MQTFALACLPTLLSGFNLSFAFPHEHSEPVCAASTELPVCQHDANVAFGNEMAKVIKETLDGEHSYRIKTIVIDAGHGGKDPGCLGSHSREKHIALAIALNLGQQIETTFPDVRVIYTRKTDEFIPLHERARIANKNNADVFISIHCNYIRKSSATHGSETYVLGLHRAEDNLDVAKRENAAILLEENYQQNYGDFDPNSNEGHIILSMYQNAYLDQSIFLAERIESRIASSAQRRSRGVKQAGFLVLRETAMPSVLVEAGFLSHSQEEAYLNDPLGQQQMAQAIFEAFQDYKNAVESPGYSSSFQYNKPQQDVEVPVAAPVAATTPAIVWDTPTPNNTPALEKPAPSQPQEARVQKVNNYQLEPVAGEDVAMQNIRSLETETRSKEQTTIPVYIPAPENMPAETINTSPRKQQPSADFTADPFDNTAAATAKNKTVKEPAVVNDKSVSNNTLNTSTPAATVPQPKSPPVTTPNPPTNNTPPQPTINPQTIQFRVQLAASPTLLNTSGSKWQNLPYLIQVIQEENLYKYQVSKLASFADASTAKEQLAKAGFTDAFIVAYDGKKRIGVPEALQALGGK